MLNPGVRIGVEMRLAGLADFRDESCVAQPGHHPAPCLERGRAVDFWICPLLEGFGLAGSLLERRNGRPVFVASAGASVQPLTRKISKTACGAS